MSKQGGVPEGAVEETAKRLVAYAHGGGHPCATTPCEDCIADACGLLAEADWWVTEDSPGSGRTRTGTPPALALEQHFIERLTSAEALEAMLEASGWADPTGDDPEMGWGTEGDPYDERPTKRDFRELIQAAASTLTKGQSDG